VKLTPDLKAALEKRGIPIPKSKPGKYANRRTEYAGVTYDSQLEANVAAQLDQLKRAGKVKHWERQVPFDVSAEGASKENRVVYRADFVVHYTTGLPRVLDPKGAQTPTFRIKRKLFRERYGFDVDLIRHYQDTPTTGRPETVHDVLTRCSDGYAGRKGDAK